MSGALSSAQLLDAESFNESGRWPFSHMGRGIPYSQMREFSNNVALPNREDGLSELPSARSLGSPVGPTCAMANSCCK